jgi:hypothetical protein
MLTVIGGLCCVGFINPIGVVAGVRKQEKLYRLSDCRLSAKLVSTFADRGLSRSQRG